MAGSLVPPKTARPAPLSQPKLRQQRSVRAGPALGRLHFSVKESPFTSFLMPQTLWSRASSSAGTARAVDAARTKERMVDACMVVFAKVRIAKAFVGIGLWGF